MSASRGVGRISLKQHAAVIEAMADANIRAEKAEARVAGLEAREAELRSALERIAAHPHGGILVNIAKHALARTQSADCGKAGP